MGMINAVPPGSPPTKADQLNKVYSDLLDDLNEAYWDAGSVDAKDKIYATIQAVSDLITQLDAADLAAEDPAYVTLAANVKDVDKQLDTLQQQINTLIARISTAATVISDIAKVLSVAATVFPVPAV